MVVVKFAYPKGKAPVNQKKYERIIGAKINAFFRDKKVQGAIKVPKTLRIVIAESGGMTPKLANGVAFNPRKQAKATSRTMTVEEICAAFERLIEQLKQVK
jgi:hypothetical protein